MKNEKIIIINGKETEYTVNKKGEIYSLNYGRSGKKKKLKQQKSKGYLYVNIYYNKKIHRKLVNRLVAKAFIPNPYNLPEVNHKDGNKENNNVKNLEWVTSKENTKHAFENNLRYVHKGEGATDAKITNNQAHEICRLLEKNKLGTREIAEKVGVSFSIVSNIKHGKAWKDISSLYNIENHKVKSKPVIKNKKSKSEVISEKTAKEICSYLQNSDLTIDEISDLFNVKPSKVKAIFYGNSWKNISSEYDFSKRRRR